MTPIEAEGEWLAGLPDRRKQLFLAALIHEITIAARSTYKSQSLDLEKPQQLRLINEAQHRVAACLHQLLLGKCDIGFQKAIASFVLDQQDWELRQLMGWVWRYVKAHVFASS